MSLTRVSFDMLVTCIPTRFSSPKNTFLLEKPVSRAEPHLVSLPSSFKLLIAVRMSAVASYFWYKTQIALNTQLMND